MKKRIIISLLFIVAGTACLSGQEKGDMYLSGSVSFSGGSTTSLSGNTSVKSPGVFGIGVSPQFGYFVADNWEIHLGVGYSFRKEPSFGDDGSTNSSMWSLSPGVSYYAGIVEGRLYYTPGLDVSLGFGGAKYARGSGKEHLYDSREVSLSLYLLSFEYRPTDHFGISLRAGSAGYTYSVTDNGAGTTVKTGSYSLGFNLSASLGFRCWF